MSAIDPKKIAADLAQARVTDKLIGMGPLTQIASLDDAYALQVHLDEAYASERIGYKVGATSEAAQKLFSCDAPFYGPIYARDRHTPGTNFKLRPGLLGGEAEFAFHCKEDLPTDIDLSVNDLPTYIADCHIAVELVGRRTEGDGLPPLNCAVADFGGNFAFLEGPSIDDWTSMDLSKVEVVAKTNGAETNRGTGAAVMGHPLESLLWLHNSLRAKGSGVKAGEWISTGTCLGVIQAALGKVDIEFKGCGEISYSLS